VQTNDNHSAEPVFADNGASWPRLSNGSPDFETMDLTQRGAYHQWRLKRKFG
jgi:hypothetical protein